MRKTDDDSFELRERDRNKLRNRGRNQRGSGVEGERSSGSGVVDKGESTTTDNELYTIPE